MSDSDDRAMERALEEANGGSHRDYVERYCADLTASSKPMPPEFHEVVSDRFWGLTADVAEYSDLPTGKYDGPGLSREVEDGLATVLVPQTTPAQDICPDDTDWRRAIERYWPSRPR